MCGRYALSSPVTSLEAQFEAEAEAQLRLTPRYNIAPTTPVPVVRNGPEGRIIVLHQWGLVPSWARDPALGARLANARAETVADKPSFRAPFRRNRCLVPADAFYEWRAGTPKQPFAIRDARGGLLALAGLWDLWEGPGGALLTCTILTTAANAAMAPIHDRMPVILAPEDQAPWLAPDTPREALLALMRPCPDAWLRVYPVGLRVGNVRNDDPSLLEPLDA